MLSSHRLAITVTDIGQGRALQMICLVVFLLVKETREEECSHSSRTQRSERWLKNVFLKSRVLETVTGKQKTFGDGKSFWGLLFYLEV